MPKTAEITDPEAHRPIEVSLADTSEPQSAPAHDTTQVISPRRKYSVVSTPVPNLVEVTITPLKPTTPPSARSDGKMTSSTPVSRERSKSILAVLNSPSPPKKASELTYDFSWLQPASLFSRKLAKSKKLPKVSN